VRHAARRRHFRARARGAVGWVLAAALLAPAPEAGATSPAEIDAALHEADAAAARARALDESVRPAAVQRALEGYDSVLALRPRDAILAARVRRRRAKLLASQGCVREAGEEYARIAEGGGRRKDRARALVDAAALQERAGETVKAEGLLRRAIEDYRDVPSTWAQAQLRLGRLAQAAGRPEEAARAWTTLVGRAREQDKLVVEAYDLLALLAIEQGDLEQARRWLERCMRRFRKRAERDDRHGAFLARQLGAMRAPRALAEAVAADARAGGDAKHGTESGQ